MSKALTPEAAEIRDLVLKSISFGEINKKDETAEGIAKEGLFVKSLPADLPIEMVNRVGNHNSNFLAGSAAAFGEMSVLAMAENKNLNRTSLEIPMGGRDKVNYHVDRQREYPNPQDKDNKIIKHGDITTNYTTYAGKNAGNLAASRRMVAELAMEKLAKK